MKIELKGGTAVVVLAVIVAVGGGKFLMERSTLEAEAAEKIKFWLRGEYLDLGLKDLDPGQLTEEEAERAAEELLSLGNIVFTSVGARGRGDDVVVRVEIEVSGGPPPDGKRIRY